MHAVVARLFVTVPITSLLPDLVSYALHACRSPAGWCVRIATRRLKVASRNVAGIYSCLTVPRRSLHSGRSKVSVESVSLVRSCLVRPFYSMGMLAGLLRMPAFAAAGLALR